MPSLRRLWSLISRSNVADKHKTSRSSQCAKELEVDIIPGFATSSKEALDVTYLLSNDHCSSVAEDHAARTATAQCHYMLPDLKAMVSHNPSLKLLDVGCGSGLITIDLARLMPEGGATGTDLSGAVLETAKANAEQAGIRNIQFVKSDVYALPWVDGTFEIVHTHQAVAHFHDPVKAIKELVRVTKKGGMLCMREGDLQTAKFYLDHPMLDECIEVIKDVHSANGGAIDAGRRLRAWTVQAGVPRESIVATRSASGYSTLEQRTEYGKHWPARCTQGAFADRAQELGVKREQLAQYALAWKQWIDDPDGVFTMMHGEVIAKL